MDKLQIPSGSRRWYCGPFVIAAITGATFETIRTAINYEKGRPSNTGVCSVMPDELRGALFELGYKTERIYNHTVHERITLKHYMKQIRDDDIYVVWVTSHYVVVQGGNFMDTYSEHKVATAYAPRAGKRVKEVYRVTKQ